MSRVVKNYIYNLSYQVLLMILPIITTPYISRVLHAEGVGKYNFAFSIISVTIIVAQLGTNMYGQREIAYVQNSKEERSRVFWEIVAIRLITTLLVFPVYLGIALCMKGYTSLLLAMSVYLLSNVLDCSWYFQGLEEFKKTALRSIASKLIGVILIFCFVKTRNDIVLYATILSASQLVGNIALLPYLKNSVNAYNLNDLSLRRHIKPVLGLFLPTAAVYVYTYIDKIILGVLSTDVEIGFYSQSEKIIKLIMTIVTSLGIVLLPHIATFVKEGEIEKIRNGVSKAISFVAMIGLPLVMGCIVIGDRFIPWFLGDGFDSSVFLFKLLSPLIVIIGLASIVGQAILIPLQKQKTYSTSIFAGAGINLVCNFLLIPNHGAVGAAIGTLIAELTVTTIQLYYVVKYIDLDLRSIAIQNCHYLPTTILMGVVGLLLNNNLPQGFIYMLVIVAFSCVVYFSALMLCRDEILYSFIKKGRKE